MNQYRIRRYFDKKFTNQIEMSQDDWDLIDDNLDITYFILLRYSNIINWNYMIVNFTLSYEIKELFKYQIEQNKNLKKR